MELLWWVVIAAGVIGLFMFIDTKYLKLGRKKDNKVRILLFEKIGEEIVYKKQVVASITHDEKLGYFIKLKKIEAIPVPDPKDFYYDAKAGRCLQLIKYGPDDYRPISRMDKGVWAKLVKKEQLKLDDKEKPIPLLDEENKPKEDEEGNILYETEEVQEFEYYNEPKGVTQLAREGVRFNRSFQKRMDELRKEKQGWWNQHGMQVLSVGVVIIFMIFMTYNQSNYYKNVKEYNIDAVASVNKAADAINQPHWAEALVKSVQREEAEIHTPLS